MTVEVIGKEVDTTKYQVTCTDENCKSILRYSEKDIRYMTRSVCGRDAGKVKGISCPSCAQMLNVEYLEKNRRE
jgi:hypothetical protein